MSKGPKPTDEETGQEMRALAEIYRTGVLEETGVKLGWGDADAVRLDQLCTAFLATRPKAAVRRSMIMALGAYLGELIVRQTGGRWVYDEKHRAAAFVTPQGLRLSP